MSIFQLRQEQSEKLRYFQGQTIFASYSSFRVEGEDFRIQVGGYEGTAGDPMRWSSINNYLFTSNLSLFFPESTTEWLSPPWTRTKTSGLETVPRQEVAGAGGSTAAVWPTSTESTSERMSTATMEFYGISMPEITEVSNQLE